MTPTWLGRLPVHASFSQLGSWNRCQQAYCIEKAFHPTETPAWWFIGGTAFHEATEAWDNGTLGPACTLLAAYHAFIDEGIAEAVEREPDQSKWMAGGRRSKAYPDKETEQFWRDVGPAWCQLYLDHQNANDEPIWESVEGCVGVELPFEVELGGVVVKGAIDRLRVTQGMLGVEDIKTGSGQSNEMQLGLYKVAVEIAFGESPTWGRFWNPRKGGAQVPVSLDRYDRKLFDSMFGAFEKQRRSGVVIPNLGPDCERCSVKRFCSAYGGAEAIDLEV